MTTKKILEELLNSVKEYNRITIKYLKDGLLKDKELINATEQISFAIKNAEDFFELDYREPDILPPLESFEENRIIGSEYNRSHDDWI